MRQIFARRGREPAAVSALRGSHPSQNRSDRIRSSRFPLDVSGGYYIPDAPCILRDALCGLVVERRVIESGSVIVRHVERRGVCGIRHVFNSPWVVKAS